MNTIISERQGYIQHIRFNRIERKNAITRDMYQALADAITAAEADGAVRVMMLYGDPACFTAGNDLKEFAENPPRSADSRAGRAGSARGTPCPGRARRRARPPTLKCGRGGRRWSP